MKLSIKTSTTAVLLAAVGLGLFTGCGGEDPSANATAGSGSDRGGSVQWWIEPRQIRGVRQRLVGEGADAAVLLWRAGGPPPSDAIVFLHGWHAQPPWRYGAWLRHLTRRANTVVYPVYQQLGEDPAGLLGNAIEGIAAGLAEADADPDTVVAIGHTTGGALAFDYAATAADEGSPLPRAVFAVYPGRNPPEGELPPADLSQIGPDTRLAVVAGPGDPLPDGNAQARALLRGATQVRAERRSFLRAPYRRSSGPFAVSGAPRRSFWTSADRLIAAARADLTASQPYE